MLQQFPFRILGSHSDNGSEFINHTVAKLLNKLLVEQTKSRPRHSNDNGLVEAKNGAVIRKHMGYGDAQSQHAEAIEAFYEGYFNPYLNFHRPCGVPELVTNSKGKTEEDIPLIHHALGDAAPLAGDGAQPAFGPDTGRTGTTGQRGKRHRSDPSENLEAIFSFVGK